MVSGWDPRPWRELRASYVFPTQEQWRREVELMMQDLEEFPSMGFPLSDNTRQAAFSIYAWNEFGEGGIMAPSQGWNTSKLSILADVVRNHSLPKKVPFSSSAPSMKRWLPVGHRSSWSTITTISMPPLFLSAGP